MNGESHKNKKFTVKQLVFDEVAAQAAPAVQIQTSRTSCFETRGPGVYTSCLYSDIQALFVSSMCACARNIQGCLHRTHSEWSSTAGYVLNSVSDPFQLFVSISLSVFWAFAQGWRELKLTTVTVHRE